jgi:hypothetical protein
MSRRNRTRQINRNKADSYCQLFNKRPVSHAVPFLPGMTKTTPSIRLKNYKSSVRFEVFTALTIKREEYEEEREVGSSERLRMGGTEYIIVFEGSQALPVCPSGKCKLLTGTIEV